MDLARARVVAEKRGISLALSPEDLIAHPDVELVLNLTTPASHAEIALAAVSAGKHVYNEKPLTIEFGDGRALLAEADRQGVRVGAAPDTFLGGAHQEVRALLDSKQIGEAVSVNGFMLSGGHESWHPSPRFYYERGGGPLFDMGPYYIAAYVNMFGPISRVSGLAKITHATRTISSKPHAGETIQVETPTHVTALFEFASGVSGQLTTSFDAPVSRFPSIVVNGSEGSLVVPDPNGFGGDIEIRRVGEPEWSVSAYDRPYRENARGIGVLDMALALKERRPHRASGALGLHVLEAMHGILRSAQSGRHVVMETTVSRPEPLPLQPFSQ